MIKVFKFDAGDSRGVITNALDRALRKHRGKLPLIREYDNRVLGYVFKYIVEKDLYLHSEINERITDDILKITLENPINDKNNNLVRADIEYVGI